MSWRAELDSLKRRASAQTRSTTADVRRIIDEMGSSIPNVRAHPVTEGDLESFYAAVKKRGIDPLPPSVTIHGWLLSLSRIATINGRHIWHLSASLHPRGRSSTTNDWKMLGHFAMHLGAPKDPTIMPEDPTRVVHWQWPEAA